MRLNRLTDYGIVLLTHFAREPEQRLSAADLAGDTHLPHPMVRKILKILAAKGFLASQRGVRGGYALARRPEEISVAAIIRALEGPISLTECTVDLGACEYEVLCPVCANWQRINLVVRAALEKVTLAEMAEPYRRVPDALPVASK